MNNIKIPKKLIEVALPLDAINAAAAREKSIRHGHPSTLHLWWARRPLAAARAVIWSSLVDDPSSLPEQFPTEEAQNAERQRLFGILERLVKWENSNNEDVLNEAKSEIMKSTVFVNLKLVHRIQKSNRKMVHSLNEISRMRYTHSGGKKECLI